jgi:hypothetical protein
MNIVQSGILGGGGGVREVLKELLRSWQLSRKKREEKLNGGGVGGGFTGLAHHSCQSTDHNGNSHISNWTHKFQNKAGLDAKANSELYKSNRVCSAYSITRPTLSHSICICKCIRILEIHTFILQWLELELPIERIIYLFRFPKD